MSLDSRVRRIWVRTSLGLVFLAAGAAGAATHSPSVSAAIDPDTNVMCSTAPACVAGRNTGSGPGVGGTSGKGIGVQGSGYKYGVQGTGTNNYGVWGTSKSGLAGVAGSTASNYGVYGFTSGSGSGAGIGVYGSSTSGYGMYGTTISGNGYGVVGSMTGAGVGTYGYSASGYGVQAVTNSGYGLYSDSSGGTGSAAYLSAGSGYGLISYSNGNVPVYARNSSGNGGDFEGTYIGIVGRAPASGGFPLTLTDESGNNLFYVDGAGNVSYHGGLFHFSRINGGAVVKSFSTTTTAPTVEDTGTAQLVGGVASVRLDPTFAASIESSTAYRVFVTPSGDTRGLFVPTKTAHGFIVRESQGGHSTVSFDYRIVATGLGQSGQRMAVARAMDEPSAKQPVAPRITAPLKAPKPAPAPLP